MPLSCSSSTADLIPATYSSSSSAPVGGRRRPLPSTLSSISSSPPTNVTRFLLVLFLAVALCDRYDDRFYHNARPMLSDRHYCYSCMSRSYLSIWDRLMHHYFPPKNFTEQCERPTAEVGVVRCDTACFTVVEEDHVGGRCKQQIEHARSMRSYPSMQL